MTTTKELIEKINNGSALIIGGGSIIKNGKRIWIMRIEEIVSLQHVSNDTEYVNIPQS